jgi:hypothetical protein
MIAKGVRLFISTTALLSCATLAKDDNVGCIASLNGYFFNLKPLSFAINE